MILTTILTMAVFLQNTHLQTDADWDNSIEGWEESSDAPIELGPLGWILCIGIATIIGALTLYFKLKK